MRKVMITADDFGFTDNTNKGIIETLENGVTTEVNLMVSCYASLNAMKYAKENNLTNLGIHLSLFNTDNGDKPYRSSDYDRVLSEWSTEKLLEVISTEIKKYEDYFGKPPSHINGHKQLHFNQKVIDYVFDYAKKNNIYVRKWGDFRSETILGSDVDFVKQKFEEYQLRRADYLFGFEYDFENPENASDNYQKLINETEENAIIEILFHPGYCDEFEKSLTSFIKEREADRMLLCSDRFRGVFENYQVISAKEV